MERSRTYQNLANQLRTAQQRFVFDLMWQGKSNRAIVRIVEPDNRHRRNAYARIKTVERSLGVDVWEVAHQERAIAIPPLLSRVEQGGVGNQGRRRFGIISSRLCSGDRSWLIWRSRSQRIQGASGIRRCVEWSGWRRDRC